MSGGRAVAGGVDNTQLEGLDALGVPDAPPVEDAQPTKPRRRSRSGTSGAERARRAREAGGTTPTAPRSRARKPAVNIAKGVENLYTMAGMGVSILPHPAAGPVGLAMGQQAKPIAAAWEQLAKENDHVRRMLEQLLTVSSVGVLVAAHLPIVLAGVAATEGPAGALVRTLAAAPQPEQSAAA